MNIIAPVTLVLGILVIAIIVQTSGRRRHRPWVSGSQQGSVYGYALRQIEARRELGLSYPDQYPGERHETDRYLGRAS